MIYRRRSIRQYKKEPVPREDLLQMLEAARVAPSAKNRQPWRFIVYEGEAKAELLEAMKAGLHREEKDPVLVNSSRHLANAVNTLRIMKRAPVVICVIDPDGFSPLENLDPDQRFTEINSTMSIGAAVENLLLKATELGYGSLWIGNTCFAYQELTEKIGQKGQLVCAVALGLPDEAPAPRPRKPIEEIVEFRK